MAEKSRSISRNQRFISGCKAALVCFLAYRFLADRSALWGLAYAAFTLLLYSRPIFNVSSAFPLAIAVAMLPISPHAATPLVRIGISLVAGLSFFAVLGVKNLAFTHRIWWLHCVSYALAYSSFLLFFHAGDDAPFFASWAFACAFSYFIFCAVMPDSRLALPAAFLTGELLLAVSWLPIGPVSSANFLIVSTLFLSDAGNEGRLTFRTRAAFPALALLIALSSRWRL